MGDLTKNISRSELSCNCGCGSDSIDYETTVVVQDACDHFAEKLGVERVTLTITSANRCFKYNRSPAVGSNDNSQHPRSRAMDIKIGGVYPSDVYSYLVDKYPGKYGIGKYKSFTHIDTRSSGPARW